MAYQYNGGVDAGEDNAISETEDGEDAYTFCSLDILTSGSQENSQA